METTPETMMTTLLLLAALLVANVLFYSFVIWWGSYLVKAAKPTYLRALGVSIAFVLMNIADWVVSRFTPNLNNAQNLAVTISIAFATFVGNVLLSWLIISAFVRTTFLRAALVWLISLVFTAAAVVVMLFLVPAYLLEAFIIPSNAMAPTVIGWHKTAVCPHCGQPIIIPVRPPEEIDDWDRSQRETFGICSTCAKTATIEIPRSEVLPPDRIIVNKLLRPQRWDIIVYRYPPNPSVKYIKRLVGLPGEVVAIKEGSVWINGVKRELPESIANIRYSSQITGRPEDMDAPEQSWSLQNDEYFVLGDFTLMSADSRVSGPVPGANIEGVVTLRYLPIARWHIWR